MCRVVLLKDLSNLVNNRGKASRNDLNVVVDLLMDKYGKCFYSDVNMGGMHRFRQYVGLCRSDSMTLCQCCFRQCNSKTYTSVLLCTRGTCGKST